MDSVSDAFDSVGKYLKSRFSSPIFAAYLISWTVLNFRVILALIGDANWRDKISYIDNVLYPQFWHLAWYGFLYPLSVAVILIACNPFLSRWITVYTKKRELRTIELLHEIEAITPLSQDEANELRRAILHEKESRRRERKQFESEVNELETQIQTLLDENRSLRSPKSTVQLEITDPPASVLQQSSTTPHDDNYILEADDFLGVSTATVERLKKRGLDGALANALYVMRNGDPYTEKMIMNTLLIFEQYDIRYLIDQLLALSLVEESRRGDVPALIISKVGRQALKAAQKNGFVPKV